jgi:hypothetical protein
MARAVATTLERVLAGTAAQVVGVISALDQIGPAQAMHGVPVEVTRRVIDRSRLELVVRASAHHRVVTRPTKEVDGDANIEKAAQPSSLEEVVTSIAVEQGAAAAGAETRPDVV